MDINQRNIRIDSALRAAVKTGALSSEEYGEACRLITAGESADVDRYRFLRNDENWTQNDRYWEALSAGGENLDKVIDDGIKSRAEAEESDDF